VRSETRIALVQAGFALLISSGAPAAPDPPAKIAGPPPPVACPAEDIAAPSAIDAGAPTPEEMRKRLERWRVERERVLSSLFEVGHPDGSISVDPQDLFSHEIVMRRNADGSISIQCLPSGWRNLVATPPARRPLETR